MTDRRTIGEILMSSGRISEADVEHALAYQREHGGFFGEALVACGMLTEGEVEWGLASQFDLPYVFPEVEAIDYDAASIVSPEWALSHLTLPIMKTEDTLSVIIDSPLKTEPLAELAARVDVDIQLALASPSRIRELIRQVYARGTAAEEEERPASPVELLQAVDAVLEVDAARFGVSVRGPRAQVWWDESGTIRRRPLAGDWMHELESAMEPSAAKQTSGRSRADWVGSFSRAGAVTPMRVRFLADESGSEYLFLPSHEERTERRPFPAAPEGVVSEVRLLARSGRARFVVTTEPSELGHSILPHLPDLVLDPTWRSIYVHAAERPAQGEAFSRRLPADSGTWEAELKALRAFHFDVVTVDLEGGDRDWTAGALDLASVAFVLWPEGDVDSAYEAGARWHMRLEQDGEGGLDWSLEPLPRAD